MKRSAGPRSDGIWKTKRNATTLDRERARRLRGIKAARRANEAIRRSGRTPGEEGRAKIMENRAKRKAEVAAAELAELKVLAATDRLPPKCNGIRPPGPLALEHNRRIDEQNREEERLRVEANRVEFEEKQRRLAAPKPAYELGRVGSTDMRGI